MYSKDAVIFFQNNECRHLNRLPRMISYIMYLRRARTYTHNDCMQ